MAAVLTRARSVDPRPFRPAIRLRPAPPLEPPFDDELAPQAWAIPDVDQLALDWSFGSVGGGGPLSVRNRARSRGDAGPPQSPPTTSGASAESRTAARRFAGTCVEILNGYRPVAHVRRLASPPEALSVAEQLGHACTRLAGRSTRAGPSRRSATGPGARPDLIRLGRLWVCQPHSGVAEVAAVLRSARHTWAFAFRLERHRGAWLCTTAELL
jgi:hypothetical protein